MLQDGRAAAASISGVALASCLAAVKLLFLFLLPLSYRAILHHVWCRNASHLIRAALVLLSGDFCRSPAGTERAAWAAASLGEWEHFLFHSGGEMLRLRPACVTQCVPRALCQHAPSGSRSCAALQETMQVAVGAATGCCPGPLPPAANARQKED